MNRVTVVLLGVLIGVAGFVDAADSSSNMPVLNTAVEHFKTSGIAMSEAVHFTAGKDLNDDGFDTLEMVKELHQDPKTLEVLYSFRLWRQKNVEQTKRRLKMGRLFNWDMTAAGTIVLEWMEGSQKNEVLKAFESFRKQQGLNKTTE